MKHVYSVRCRYGWGWAIDSRELGAAGGAQVAVVESADLADRLATCLCERSAAADRQIMGVEFLAAVVDCGGWWDQDGRIRVSSALGRA